MDDGDIWEKCNECCCPPAPRPPQRTIILNRQSTALASTGQRQEYPKNKVITSRYTWYNFLFKNLFEQLMRIANAYFVVVCILQLVNPDSPTSPYTSVVPLVFVLLVTAIKQGYEDILRHQEDDKVNNKLIDVVRHGRIEQVKSQELQVGEVIRVLKNEPFPCDLVLLSSALPTGDCYVTTASLDGETNLKTYKSARYTKTLTTGEALWDMRGVIECEQPTIHLYKFSGRLLLARPVSDKNGKLQNSSASIAPADTAKDDVLSMVIAVQPASETHEYADSAVAAKQLGRDNAAFDAQNDADNDTSVSALSPVPLDEKNVLLRGARLRNTEFVFGCVLYTGPETKLALNSRGKRLKFSSVEKRLNMYLLVFFALLMLITCLSTGLVYWYRDNSALTNNKYLQPTIPAATALQGFLEWLNYFILYSYLIPLSLYVTIELQKFIGSAFFGWDILMYDKTRQERAKANTSDLNEELGQIEFLFSDKTGTLTENEMCFRECCVGTKHYADNNGRLVECSSTSSHDKRDSQDEVAIESCSNELLTFFSALALCHTCRVERTAESKAQQGIEAQQMEKREAQQDGELEPDGTLYEYQAASPDEKALLIAARQYGIVYHGLVDDDMLLSTSLAAVGLPKGTSAASASDWTFERYRLLHVLEFDSTRKCMSVIVQKANGAYWLITKGAETSLFERAARGNDAAQRTIMEQISEYATRGLRTLVIGHRTIDGAEYAKLDKTLREAQLAIADREQALQAAYRAAERDLELLGATGVEDRLQDGVGETIANLRTAGVIVWVLTGDKQETAVNIAHSCALFTENMRILRLVEQTDTEACESGLRTLLEQVRLETDAGGHEPGSSAPQYALVIDGASLAIVVDRKAHEHERLKAALVELCLKCISVLCCRVTPLQKAEVVKLVKDGVKGVVTCAIGDGANDVSMIQEAHVGLGIIGMEGRQAAQTSDYCFSRFRYLNRVLLLHGHFYYQRISILLLYFFYKNIVYVLNLFFYQFACAYSQVSLYDALSLAVFNVTYATLPILIYSLFEQHINRDLLLEKPELYKLARHNATLSYGNLALWLALGIYHALVIAFLAYAYFFTMDSTLPDGMALDSSTYGAFTLMCVILTVNIRLMIETRFWAAPEFASFACTIFFGFFFILLIYEGLLFSVSSWNDSYFVFEMVLLYPTNWLACFGIIMVCLLPDLLIRAVNDTDRNESQLKTKESNRRTEASLTLVDSNEVQSNRSTSRSASMTNMRMVTARF